MEKSLADQYLDGDIEVEEYTARVIAEAQHLSESDLEQRKRKLLENLGGLPLKEDT